MLQIYSSTQLEQILLIQIPLIHFYFRRSLRGITSPYEANQLIYIFSLSSLFWARPSDGCLATICLQIAAGTSGKGVSGDYSKVSEQVKKFQTNAVEALLSSSESAHTWIQIQYTPAQLLKRPRFCNVCREKLTGFPQHGWSCDVCKIKTHRKCMNHVADKCKWTIECLIPHHLQYISPENSIMPHQWVEGNISPSSRCAVCERNCGSALRLQDWRCLWCACTVHDGCLAQLGRGCNLGAFAISCLPPLSVNEISPEGEYKLRWDAIGSECGGNSPLCVMVNSKSGDSQGQRMIRKFKRLLNPIQIFDIISCGPDFALSLFKSLDSFRILVCGGDGTVGWVLTAMDRLDLHKKCQLAVLPLGTGNDLARVLGWGHAFYNVHELPQLLQEFERAPTSMLDRWSVMIMDGPSANAIKQYETRLKEQLRRVLFAEEPHEVIQSVRQLCGTIKELMKDVEATYSKVEEWERQAGQSTNDPVTGKCATLMAKLDNLMKSLDKHSDVQTGESGFEAELEENVASEEKQRRDSLVCRANSLKKAIKDIMDMAEKGLEQHIRESGASAKRAKFRTKRSKTTPGLKISASNLSSSSACSPPVSPSVRRDRLTVDGSQENNTPTGTSGYGPSPNLPFSAAASTELLEPNGFEHLEESESENTSANIGSVQPPTPASTREHSTAMEPDRPPLEGERLFKPMSECQLFSQVETADIKLSHSDSSIFEHAAGSGRNNIRLREGRLDQHYAQKEKHRRSAQESKAKFLFELMNALDHPYLLSSGLSDLPLLGPPTNSVYRNLPSLTPAIEAPSAERANNKKSSRSENFVVGGSLIAEVLLLNASVLGIAGATCVSPLDTYKEAKVMNNYFGIGLDAKIALDFHNKREGSEKTRSRSKLFLWYGMLGGRELMHRTYRNLDQRIRLECDGVPIDLPSLQGIVILNIPSYSGGANFWGTAKEEGFVAQSFDDKLLEVVALFGVMHVATSRVPNVVRLQNHRIAQCRHVRIVVLGNEPIPVQVDGEPWMQPPGILQIVHKNRAQLLVRDPAFNAALKKWEEQKERSTAPSTPTAIGITFARRAGEFLRLVESEIPNLGVTSAFLEAMDMATNSIRTADQSSCLDAANYDERSSREEVLAAVEQVVDLLESHFGWPENKVPANQPRLGPAPFFSFEIHGAEPDQWRYVISCIRQEISREEASLRELCQSLPPSSKKRGRFSTWISRQWRRRGRQPGDSVSGWTLDEVSSWLGSLGLSEYSEQFKDNDVRGAELLHLEKADLNDLGVSKIGHIKRLQTAINDLLEAEKQRRRSGRKGVSLSVERNSMSVPSIEPPSLSSL